jgi:GTP-sensing pleiotropic transcriptional regulator CodY
MWTINEVPIIDGFSITKSFLTDRLVQQLNLRKFKAPIPVQGINEVTKAIHYVASLEIKSRFSNWETEIDCAIHPKITGTIPGT